MVIQALKRLFDKKKRQKTLPPHTGAKRQVLWSREVRPSPDLGSLKHELGSD